MTREFTPHDYQREALQHVYELPRQALWMPMGGGKTATVLTALTDLDMVEEVFPALVLAPKTVARVTWPDEVAKWAHTRQLRVSYVGGTRQQREAALRVPADIYTMAYDNLEWLVGHLGASWPFATVVADELSRLKSFRLRQGSVRARALGKVAHTKVKRFIGLTGTPAANGLKDLWGQIWFLDKGERLGNTFSAFESRWFKKGYDGYSLVPYDHSEAEIHEKLKDICLTVKGLPVDEAIVAPRVVELPPKAMTMYRDMERFMFAELEAHGIEAATAAVKTNKCLQICNGAAYLDDQGNWEAVHDAKLDTLESILEEAAGMPVLCSYSFISDRERILKRFPKARHMDGEPATIKRWNEGDIALLVAHPASAGHGLSLQDGGNILTDFGLTWNLEHWQQILERIGPMRQKQSGYDRPVFRYPIIAKGTLDELVMERLETKKSVQDVLLAAMQRRKTV